MLSEKRITIIALVFVVFNLFQKSPALVMETWISITSHNIKHNRKFHSTRLAYLKELFDQIIAGSIINPQRKWSSRFFLGNLMLSWYWTPLPHKNFFLLIYVFIFICLIILTIYLIVVLCCLTHLFSIFPFSSPWKLKGW